MIVNVSISQIGAQFGEHGGHCSPNSLNPVECNDDWGQNESGGRLTWNDIPQRGERRRSSFLGNFGRFGCHRQAMPTWHRASPLQSSDNTRKDYNRQFLTTISQNCESSQVPWSRVLNKLITIYIILSWPLIDRTRTHFGHRPGFDL